MSYADMFDELTDGIRSVAKDFHLNLSTLRPLLDLVSDMKSQVLGELERAGTLENSAGTPDDIFTKAQADFHALVETGALNAKTVDFICGQLAVLRVHANNVDFTAEEKPPTAPDILNAGIGHMRDRAVTYDRPQGERSMPSTVIAFNALTRHKLTEEQGWLFMELLKCARAEQGEFKLDNYEDAAAYAGLKGEAAYQEKVMQKKLVQPQ